MPKQYRWYLKRKVRQAKHNVDIAQNYLVEVGSNYKERYPDIYQKFSDVVSFMEQLKGMCDILDKQI